MIRYSLSCDNAHAFEAWFASSSAFDTQRADEAIACPVCDSRSVSKALMAPAVSTPSRDGMLASAGHPDEARMRALLRALKAKVVAENEYVGDRFAEEARRIHYNEVEARGIYGEANRDDLVSLLDEGIDFLPLPDLPDDKN